MNTELEQWKDKAMQLDLVLATTQAELEQALQDNGRLRAEVETLKQDRSQWEARSWQLLFALNSLAASASNLAGVCEKAQWERLANKVSSTRLALKFAQEVKEESPGAREEAAKWLLSEKQLRDVEAERDALRTQKDGAYAERNRCVALIARLALLLGWRAGVREHPAEDTAWEADWRTIVSIDLPTGQASWHFHDSERHLLGGLPRYPQPWDGHSTEEKYRRIAAVPVQADPRCVTCGKPATCLGAYEGAEDEEYACDTCCGHGNEDGHCERLAGVSR